MTMSEIVLVILLVFIVACIAWYVFAAIMGYKYIKACGGEHAWLSWIPLSVRGMGLCLAHNKVHPLNVPECVYIVMGFTPIVCSVVGFVPYIGIMFGILGWGCSIALLIFQVIYIYSIACDLGKSGVFYALLYLLFMGISEPFILNSLRKGIEEVNA